MIMQIWYRIIMLLCKRRIFVMDMTLRWYGPGYDSVTLKQIRQIPGVKNVITTLFGKQAGERWLPEEIAELKRIVEDAGWNRWY
ncbi:Mannonate dehydratase [human gut metagenome]|uniref:Mannonate dehydratase n=1 Tax=human gut metagenome TaxID=408170 RepID=K1RND3_9ZZZZ